MQRAIRIAQVLGSVVLAGCSSLLPTADVATQQAWASFEEARAAVERVVPRETTRAELSAAGIDPLTNAAVTILGFPDVMQRFASGTVLDPKELDLGIRECLAAGNDCTGYAIQVRRSDRRRIGNFWADTFNFRRETDVTGWNFNALLLFVGDVVSYKVHGGQPLIHEKEVSRNPLGPLQGLGEAAGSALAR
jgi:outer membrane murein-binding lipoprotein Lpp